MTVSVALIGGQLLDAGQASAAAPGLTGTATCQLDGTYTVDWQFTNGQPVTATVDVTSFEPAGATVAPQQTTAAPNGSAEITESGIPGSSPTATLRVDVDRAGYPSSAAASVPLAPGCRASHVAAPPSARDGQCNPYTHLPVGPSVTIPADGGVSYALDGSIKGSGQYSVPAGVHTVTASSTEFTLTGRTSWSFTLTPAPPDCAPTAVPVAPAITQSACVTGSTTPSAPTLRLANTPDVSYLAAPAGPYRAGETVIVTAVAGSGYTFQGPGRGGWTFVDAHHETYTVTFDTAPDCRSTVQPVDPTAVQSTCGINGAPSAPTLTVATTPEVRYTVSPVGPYAGGQTVTVAAMTAADARFAATPPPGWHLVSTTEAVRTVTFAASPTCTRTIVPVAPTFLASYCNGPSVVGPSVTIPSTAGVTYRLDGVTKAAGSYPAVPGGTVTIVALAEPGYVLAGISTWQHTFPAGSPTCSARLVAAAPQFRDASCASPASAQYVIPTVAGVAYTVAGVARAAGSHAATPGTTLTVAVRAQSGYTLVGVTQWTHHFAALPICTAAPTPPQAGGSAGTAMTGPPTGPLLLSGLLLLLLGLACSVAGSPARSRGRGRPSGLGFAVAATTGTVAAGPASRATDRPALATGMAPSGPRTGAWWRGRLRPPRLSGADPGQQAWRLDRPG